MYIVFHNYRTPYVIVIKLLNKLIEIDEILQKHLSDYDTSKTVFSILLLRRLINMCKNIACQKSA